MIQYMDQALNQELEILVLLDKQMDENVKDLNQNLETLKKSL